MSHTDFRVFLCSTFEDFRAERSMLQTVFARLSTYCESRGAQFQAVDLRWGISEEASREQRTLDLCLQEIARCKAFSPRPNFICLLGNRYGWRPLPARIHEADLDALPLDRSERELIDRYYPVDSHAREATRILVHRGENGAEWEGMQVKLRRIFTRSVLAWVPACAGMTAQRRFDRLERSATHTEIMHGVFADAGAHEHALVFERCLDISSAEEAPDRYLDQESENEFRTPAPLALAQLKSALAVTMGPRYRRLDASIVKGEPDVHYLTALANAVEQDLRASIDEVLAAQQRRTRGDSENSAHEQFGASRAANFHGREAELERLTSYATGPALPTPALLVTGAGGTGKSALLAKAAERLAGRGKTIVVQRYVGAAALASQPAALFSGIMAKIRAQSSRPSADDDADEYATTDADTFVEFLARLDPARPVAILIDGIEHLRLDRPRDVLKWLPQAPPANVRLIVAGRDSPVLQILRQVFSSAPELTLGNFAALDAMICIENILAGRGRQLSEPLRTQVQERVSAGALPLEAKLLAEQLASTRSFDACPILGHNLDSSIDAIIDRLTDPREHLPPFSQRALMLLAVASDGMSEREMQSILARDPAVVAAFTRTARHPWDVSLGLPSILWSRLLDAMSPYLMERESEGQIHLTFFHQEFPARVRARLLASPPAEEQTHGLLADYFDQPMDPGAYRSVATGNSLLRRRVRVLAAHLWGSGRVARWSEVIQDFSFLMARCAARLPETLLADLALPARVPAEAHDMVTFLRATVALLSTSAAWPAYRVLLQRAMEQPARHAARRSAEKWLDSGACDWVWLCNARSDAGPQNLARTRFADHAGGVTGMVAGPNGTLLSWSGDGVLRLSDIETGVELSSSEAHAEAIRAGVLDGERIITWSVGQICVSSCATGVRIREFAVDSRDLMRVERLSDGELLALREDGSLQRCYLADGRVGPPLNTEPAPQARHVFMQRVDFRIRTHGQVLRWRGAEIALWDIPAGNLVTAFTLSYASFRPESRVAGIVTATSTLAGELLVADDCGRLFRCAADRSSIELLWGGDSPHYWVEQPYNGGATQLDDGRLLVWQAFFGKIHTQVERAWSMWDTQAGRLVSEGRTSSEILTTSVTGFMDILTPSSMHHYPLMHLSGAQFIGCHGTILTLTDLDAGTERVLRRVSKGLSHYFCGIVDRRTIAFVDGADSYLMRVDDSISDYLLAQGQGHITSGIAASDNRYVIGMTGGLVLGVDLAVPPLTRSGQSGEFGIENAVRSYRKATLLPGGRVAAVDPMATLGEVAVVDLDNGSDVRVLQAHGADLDAQPSDDPLKILAQTDTGRELAQLRKVARDAVVVSGMLLTLGADGLKFWDCASYERIYFFDLSAELGCRQVIALWRLAQDRLVPATPEMEPPHGELLVLVMSWMGDVYLLRPMQQKIVSVFRGRAANSKLGHSHNRRMKLFEERWLLCWHGFAPPQMFDLHAVLAAEAATPITVFQGVADHLPLDAHLRDLIEEDRGRPVEVARKTFAEVQDVVPFGADALAFVRNGGDVLLFDRAGSKLGAFRGDRLVRLDATRAAAWLSGQRALRTDGRYRVHALPSGEMLAESPRHPADIAGVKLPEGETAGSELLSWTAADRYFRWQPGTAQFQAQGRVLDALEDQRTDVTVSEDTPTARIDGHCWSAWAASESIVLSQAATQGRRAVTLWRGDERLTVHAIDVRGVVVATTLSGRLLVLQLRRGAERIALADCAAPDEETVTRLHGEAATQNAAWLRSAAMSVLRFSRSDIADRLLTQAENVFAHHGLEAPVIDRMWEARARLLHAWNKGDTQAILSCSTGTLESIAAIPDDQFSDQKLLLWADAVSSYCVACAAAGDVSTALEDIKVLARVSPSVDTKPMEDRAALLITLTDHLRKGGWVTSARAGLVLQQAKLAASRAIAEGCAAGQYPELVIQELQNLVGAAGHARDLSVARAALGELESCFLRTTAQQKLTMLAVFRAQVFADIAEPGEARSAFGKAEEQLRSQAAAPADDRGQLAMTMSFYRSWIAFESSRHEPQPICTLAGAVCWWLLRRIQPPKTLDDASLDELVLVSSVATDLLSTQDDDLDSAALEQKTLALEVLEPVATALAKRRKWERASTDLAAQVNMARCSLVFRTDQQQGLQIRRAAVSLYAQAHQANHEQESQIQQTCADLFARLLEHVDAKAAHEFAHPVVRFLHAEGLSGDVAAARALHGMMMKMVELLEHKQLTSDARAIAFSLAVLLREILDKHPTADLRGQWAQAAARSIDLVYRDLGLEQGAKIASHWQDVAFSDVKAVLQRDRVGNWLQIVLAEFSAHIDLGAPLQDQALAGLRTLLHLEGDALKTSRLHGSRTRDWSQFEQAAIACLAATLQGQHAHEFDETMTYVLDVCGGVLPTKRWQAVPALQPIIERLRKNLAPLSMRERSSIAARFTEESGVARFLDVSP